MRPIKKAVATVGKYMKDGQEKNRYLTVGKVMQRDDGSLCLKLDSIPLGPDWSGWINFYDLEDNNSQQGKGYPEPQRQQTTPPPSYDPNTPAW